MKTTSISHGRGFTLIELLVVIAIIALLVSLLVPTLSAAKELARRIVCLSKERTIAIACLTYAEEFNEALPQPFRLGWAYVPYVLEDETAKALTEFGIPVEEPYEIWHCPSTDIWPRGWYPGEPDRFHMDNYMILTWLRGQPGYFGSRSPHRAEDPTGPLVAEYTRWWNHQYHTWWSNHQGADEVVAGHNQIWTDGHGGWVAADQLADLPALDGWMFDPDGGGVWCHYYWTEE